MLSAEDLLAGSGLVYEVEVPGEILHPGERPDSGAGKAGANGHAQAERQTVRLRPLTVRDLQLITRAAKENDSLTATLMVQQALVEPVLSVAQVAGLHVGLVEFLLDRVNQISGIAATPDDLSTAAAQPLVKASFALAQAFGWTPQQVQELTLGQVLLHLEMLQEGGAPVGSVADPAGSRDPLGRTR